MRFPGGYRGKFTVFPWGLLGCVFCVAIVERELGRHALLLTPSDTFSWAYCGREAARPLPGGHILCLGSSMSLNGVIPSVLDGVTGRKSRNLALTFGAPAAQAVLLQRVLDAGSNPAALLIEVHPGAMAEGPRFAARFWPELLRLGETPRFAWSARDPTLLLGLATNEALPSLRWRDSLRLRVMRDLRGESSTESFANLLSLRNRRRNDGAIVLAAEAHNGSIPRHVREGVLPETWSPLPWNLAWIEHAIEHAEARGIPVFWHIPPFCPEVLGERVARGLDVEFTQMLLGIMERHHGLTVIDARRSGYGNAELRDAMHLNRRGAVAYSMALGRIVRDRLERKAAIAPERWVALPRFEPVDDPGLEDLTASAIALWSSDAAKTGRPTR